MPLRPFGAVLLGATTLAGAGMVVLMARSTSAVASPAAPAATTFYSCKPVDVSAYANRIHVRCSAAASGGIYFFAAATANTAHANRLLSVAMMAYLSNRKVVVEYDPSDTSGAAFGCEANDCRRMLSAGIE